MKIYNTYLPNNKAIKNFAILNGFIFEKCPGLDSNQHTSRRRHLKTVRLPISPPGRGANIEETV